MNEIYKTIEHFEHLQKRYTTQHNGKHCELVKTALAALREKAEREKGCEWCIDMGDFDRFEHYRIDREGNAEVHAHMVLANLSRFCPMCGKRLEVEHELSDM